MTGQTNSLSMRDLKSLAEKAISVSSEFLSSQFNISHEAFKKNDSTVYTEVDLKSEQIILDLLKEHTPDFHILSEETRTEQIHNAEYIWIVDPLDGTHNYYHHVPLFANQIALVHNGEVVLGVIGLPAEKLIVSAVKGEGVFINGEKVSVQQEAKKGGMLFLESYLDQTDMNILQKCVGKIDDIRILNSACTSMAYLALGRGNIVIDRVDKPWDLAAGSLIVQESGGIVTDLKGESFNVFDPQCVATNNFDHQAIINLIHINTYVNSNF